MELIWSKNAENSFLETLDFGMSIMALMNILKK